MANPISNFSPAPMLDDRESLREACSVDGHGSFVNARVEQFDGSWLAKG